ncbi:MAG: cell division protein ZapE [Ferrovum sp.]|nr:cell division protein ZapE [Ferrovum sp.]NDU87504.1 cell division protein ZapE [Ferrovum sp.]
MSLMGPLAWYRTFCARPDYEEDAEQRTVVAKFQQLYVNLMAFKDYRQTLLSRTFGNRRPPRGIYLHGGVGRGKSALMDGFYSTLPYRRKKRIHFHEFMAKVHERLRSFSGQEDPLKRVAAEWAVETRVLCFDEFHVRDIADAMILQRLLEAMIDWGTVLVITSNQAPEELYSEGLHRDRFLPAIALLRERLDVIELGGGRDHRQRSHESSECYFYPLNHTTETAFMAVFHQLCPIPEAVAHITLMERILPLRGICGRTLWIDFAVLCGSARSQRDYLELVEQFDSVLLSEVPVFTVRDQDAIRRFIWLVDILYDRRRTLVVSAAASPEGLYPEGLEVGEFARTVSRLQEMQSQAYRDVLKPG